MAKNASKKDEKKPVEDAHKKNWTEYQEARGREPDEQNKDGMVDEYTKEFVQGFGKDLQDPDSPIYQHFKPAFVEDLAKEGYLSPDQVREATKLAVEQTSKAMEEAAREGYIYTNSNDALSYEEEAQIQKDIDAIWDAYEKNKQDALAVINKRKELDAEYRKQEQERNVIEANRAAAEARLTEAEKTRAEAEEHCKEVEIARGEIDEILAIYEGLPEAKDYSADLEKIREAGKEAEALVGAQEMPAELDEKADKIDGGFEVVDETAEAEKGAEAKPDDEKEKEYAEYIEKEAVIHDGFEEPAQEPAEPQPAQNPALDEKEAKMIGEAEKAIKELETVLDNYEKDDRTADMPRNKLLTAKEAYEKRNYEDAMAKAYMGLGMVDKKKRKAKEEKYDDLEKTIKEIDEEATRKGRKK